MIEISGTNFEREWDYRYHERLGMICGSGDPTPAQRRIAREEADAAIREFKEILALTGSSAAGVLVAPNFGTSAAPSPIRRRYSTR